MVNKKRLRRYLDKELTGMKNNLNDMTLQVDAEKLHALRLNAKKVKAVLGFLKESLHNKNKYAIKELQELFHTAGDIRTAQLNLKTLEDHEIKIEPFETDQKEVMEEKSKVIADKNKKFNKNISSIKKKIGQNLTSIKNNSVIAFYYDNIKILSNNFKVIDEVDLHDSRKIIKKLLYNLKILPPSLTKKININRDYLDDLQELIGKWHDTFVTLELLSKTGSVDGDHFSFLINKKEERLKKIVQGTRDFDSNVMFAKPISGR